MHDVMGTGRLIAGRYRLYDPIGRGAMGIVWRGRDELLARDVAVKEVQITSHASPADAEVLYQRTLREARTAARLSHPSVVTVFDVVEENGSPWIVMELIDARSLDQVITEDGPLPPEQAADLGASLISALATAHSAGVLHRDVKPSNVLVTKEGQAVLTDFGIATFSEDLGITQAGMVVGTPGFTAPERIRGDIATPASDLWSLGATLYAAVEGRGPFDRIGGSSVITAGVAGEDAPRAPSAGPLGPVIDALLSRDPGTRPDATTAARLLADAATAARTGPRPLRDGWLAAEASREPDTENTAKSAAAGEMGLADSGFLDPPDYEVLQIPDSHLAADSAGSGELASGPAPAAAGLAAVGVAAGVGLAADDRLAAAGQQSAAAPAAKGSNLDPGSGPALWGPVKGKGARGGDRGPGQPGPARAESAQTEAAPPPVPPGPGQGGPGSTDGGRWGAAGRAWRSSGRWRLAVAASGIAAIVVAAVVGYNIFQHTGPVSALGGVAPPGSTAQPAVSGRPAAGGSGSKSSGSHSGSGGPVTGSASGSHGSSQGSGNPSSKPSGASHPSTGPSGGSPGTPTPTPSVSASPTPSPTVSTSPGSTAPVLPAGYRWHKFTAATMGSVAGFKIGVPDAWTQVISGQAAHLNQTVRNFHLTVNLAYWLYAKPLREAQYLQGQAAAAHSRDYKVLTLAAVGFKAVGGYRSAAAAELKYSWKNVTSGVDFAEQVLLVTLSTSAGSQPYTLSLWAPTATFPAANGIFHTALPTFRPMPGA